MAQHTDRLGPPRARQAGFSLIEVLVSILLVAVAVLGLAKVQSLSMSSTKVSSSRTLAAYQTASMVASIESNRKWWAEKAPATLEVLKGGAAPAAAASCVAPATLTTPVCPDSEQVARFDAAQWGAALRQTLPDAEARVECAPVVPTQARQCDVVVSWVERLVSIDNDSARAATAAALPRQEYRLSVWP